MSRLKGEETDSDPEDLKTTVRITTKDPRLEGKEKPTEFPEDVKVRQ